MRVSIVSMAGFSSMRVFCGLFRVPVRFFVVPSRQAPAEDSAKKTVKQKQVLFVSLFHRRSSRLYLKKV